MPEGDTIHRTATVMRQTLGADPIVAARARPGGAQLARLVGSRTRSVSTHGKHLLISFDSGLTLHTHLGMHGSWHRYRPAERWRRPARDAAAVLQTERAVAVCFSAPTVELVETRALAMHPVLAALGPDLLAEDVDLDEAARRLLASPGTVAEALLDQRVVAGIGNVYRSEVLAGCRVDPFAPASSMAPEDARRLVGAARAMLSANLQGRPRATVPEARRGERWAYGRAGRPCRRCGSAIRTRAPGQPPRRLYWCPTCQARAT